MSNNINNQAINQMAYESVKEAKVYASADNIEQDSKITREEALARKTGIFNVAQKAETVLNEALNTSTRLSDDKKAIAKSLIQKYLGGISLSSLLNNWTGFSTINYTAVDINDSENTDDVRAQIDTKVDAQIEQGINSVGSNAINQYKAAITKALSQAENELAGDADIIDEEGNVKGKDEKFNLSDISYKRSSENGKNTNVATYNSNSKGADVTQGYSNTVQYLQANGAKAKEKTVNGVKQMVYEVKADGQKQYVVVDDAGQVHNLSRDKGFLRASKFTTEDSIEDAKYQANNDKDKNNDIKEGTNVKVKVRKVDGQEQSVMIWKDENGNKHSRVIDYNNVTGLTTSSDVHQVNAGGRAKYASETSGLGALVNKTSKDEIYFDNAKHKLHTGKWTDDNGGVHDSYVRTEGKRMKLDAGNISVAISNITKLVQNAGGNVQDSANSTNVNINGHDYTIDKMDNKSADKTMRLIQGELDKIAQNDDSMTDTIPSEITLKPFDIVEDNRIDANIKRDGSKIIYPDGKEYTTTDEKWKSGETVEGAGVNKNTHQTDEKGKGKVNTVKYAESLTQKQFVSEGWRTDSARTKEQQYLKLMDSQDIKGNSKSVRNLKTGKEFAERFIAAYKKQNNDNGNYDANKLADAIMAANPSLFDGFDKIMYQNADFSRLNLPTNIDRFKVDAKQEDTTPLPVKQEPPLNPVVV